MNYGYRCSPQLVLLFFASLARMLPKLSELCADLLADHLCQCPSLRYVPAPLAARIFERCVALHHGGVVTPALLRLVASLELDVLSVRADSEALVKASCAVRTLMSLVVVGTASLSLPTRTVRCIARLGATLTRLSLPGCAALGDATLAVLARGLPSLEALNVSRAPVTSAGLEVLARHCGHLEELRIRECTRLRGLPTRLLLPDEGGQGGIRRIDVTGIYIARERHRSRTDAAAAAASAGGGKRPSAFLRRWRARYPAILKGVVLQPSSHTGSSSNEHEPSEGGAAAQSEHPRLEWVQAPWLRSPDGSPLGRSFASFMASMCSPSTKALCLARTSILPVGFTGVDWTVLSSLRYLDLRLLKGPDDEAIAAALAACASTVEVVLLRSTSAGDACARALSLSTFANNSITSTGRLKRLDFGETAITLTGINSLAATGALPHLHTLSLVGCAILQDENVRQGIERLWAQAAPAATILWTEADLKLPAANHLTFTSHLHWAV